MGGLLTRAEARMPLGLAEKAIDLLHSLHRSFSPTFLADDVLDFLAHYASVF